MKSLAVSRREAQRLIQRRGAAMQEVRIQEPYVQWTVVDMFAITHDVAWLRAQLSDVPTRVFRRALFDTSLVYNLMAREKKGMMVITTLAPDDALFIKPLPRERGRLVAGRVELLKHDTMPQAETDTKVQTEAEDDTNVMYSASDAQLGLLSTMCMAVLLNKVNATEDVMAAFRDRPWAAEAQARTGPWTRDNLGRLSASDMERMQHDMVTTRELMGALEHVLLQHHCCEVPTIQHHTSARAPRADVTRMVPDMLEHDAPSDVVARLNRLCQAHRLLDPACLQARIPDEYHRRVALAQAPAPNLDPHAK